MQAIMLKFLIIWFLHHAHPFISFLA